MQSNNGGGGRSLWGLGGLLIGFSIALIFCWFTWVRPLQAHLDAREKAIHEWEEINRRERSAIADIKTLSIEQLRNWVSSIEEQNVRFAELQQKVHRAEIDLTGPGTSYLALAVVAVLGVTGLLVFWFRDSNASAATTLENIVALAPDGIVRAAVHRVAELRQPATTILRLEDGTSTKFRKLSRQDDGKDDGS